MFGGENGKRKEVMCFKRKKVTFLLVNVLNVVAVENVMCILLKDNVFAGIQVTFR